MSVTHSAANPSILHAWAQLVRLPTVFTVLANVGAAFLLVSGGAAPLDRFLAVLVSGVLLYWAGMILNDVFDVEDDRQQGRPGPLVRGTVSIGQARAVSLGLLIAGIVVAGVSGYLPSETHATTWLPLAVAIALAVTIVAYDGPLKQTPIAPAAMGGCRLLCFVLGASPLLGTADGFLIPKYVLGIGVGIGTYVMGLTLFGRRESADGPSIHLPMGTLVTLFGAILLAVAPLLERAPVGWFVDDLRFRFPMLIGLIAFPVVIRAYRAVSDPTAAKIQMTMRIGILTLIPISAAFAYLGAGPQWGLAVFALVIPSMWLSKAFRVT